MIHGVSHEVAFQRLAETLASEGTFSLFKKRPGRQLGRAQLQDTRHKYPDYINLSKQAATYKAPERAAIGGGFPRFSDRRRLTAAVQGRILDT